MNRLTEEECYIKKHNVNELDLWNKLGQLEDIEEELGIDLITLFKALQNGVWVEVNPIDIDFENPKTMYLEEFLTLEKRLDGTLCLDARDYVDELELKDYKKTWWLKEDKTE